MPKENKSASVPLTSTPPTSPASPAPSSVPSASDSVKKTWIISITSVIGLVVILFFIFLLTSFFKIDGVSKSPELSTEELANIMKPSIVRVLHIESVKADFTPNFKLDLLNLKVIPTTAKLENIEVPTEDSYMTGTGFIISPDGNIITNAHVVAEDGTTEDQTINAAVNLILENTYNALPESQQKKVDKIFTDDAKYEEVDNFYSDLKSNIQDVINIKNHSRNVVVNPSTKGTDLISLAENGFEAKILMMNDNYEADQYDVALLKIDQKNLPSLPLASEDDALPFIGQNIYSFGFPGNADIGGTENNRGFLESTFGSGLITSIKDSMTAKFKIFQSDIKIAGGSSGSPIVDKYGKVKGIFTYESISQSGEGDTFSFAIPIQTAFPALLAQNITPVASGPSVHFVKGLEYLKKNNCTEAVKEFVLAEDINQKFPMDKTFIDKYLSQCPGGMDAVERPKVFPKLEVGTSTESGADDKVKKEPEATIVSTEDGQKRTFIDKSKYGFKFDYSTLGLTYDGKKELREYNSHESTCTESEDGKNLEGYDSVIDSDQLSVTFYCEPLENVTPHAFLPEYTKVRSKVNGHSIYTEHYVTTAGYDNTVVIIDLPYGAYIEIHVHVPEDNKEEIQAVKKIQAQILETYQDIELDRTQD